MKITALSAGNLYICIYRGADKFLARPGRKQAREHVRDARDFNNIETRAVIKCFFLQGKAPKEIHAILREILACFIPGQAKDLSAPLYICIYAYRYEGARFRDIIIFNYVFEYGVFVNITAWGRS